MNIVKFSYFHNFTHIFPSLSKLWHPCLLCLSMMVNWARRITRKTTAPATPTIGQMLSWSQVISRIKAEMPVLG